MQQLLQHPVVAADPECGTTHLAEMVPLWCPSVRGCKIWCSIKGDGPSSKSCLQLLGWCVCGGGGEGGQSVRPQLCQAIPAALLPPVSTPCCVQPCSTNNRKHSSP
jgi:hypothetical protein